MNTVYLLWHTRKREEGEDPELLIGVYRTEADATDAIERFRLQPGFAEYPEGFLVVAYELGKDHWTKDYQSAWRPGHSYRAAITQRAAPRLWALPFGAILFGRSQFPPSALP